MSNRQPTTSSKRGKLQRNIFSVLIATSMLAGGVAVSTLPASATTPMKTATVKATTKTPITPSNFTSTSTKVANGALVSWTKAKYATRYKVVVADNRGLNKHPKTWWTTGTKFTVPLNSRDGQVRFVKVYAYNGTAVKHSPTITVFPKGLSVAKGEPVKVVSQNVLCAGCGVTGYSSSELAWGKRAPIHLSKIRAQNPDILLLQEAYNVNNALTGFYQQLEKSGWTDGVPVAKASGNGKGNRVLFKKSKFDRLDIGEIKLPNNGAVTWVLLKSKLTGKQFYAVSAHPSNKATVKEKANSAESLHRQLALLNKKNLPIFIGGDMNSSPFEALTTSHSVLMKHGWTDAVSALKVQGNRDETHNVMTKNPLRSDYSRIDYLYSKNTGGWSSYTNVLKVVNGRVTDKQASDHSMIVGTTTIK